MSDPTWPEGLPAVQVRFARPTDQLAAVERFYCEGLGLLKLGEFRAHAGYDGIFIGMPGFPYHLEFTQHEAGSPCPAPTRDNLLVLYIPDQGAIDRTVTRLEAMGHPPVEPENPYWIGRGVTIEDPDGWRVVLVASPGIGSRPG